MTFLRDLAVSELSSKSSFFYLIIVSFILAIVALLNYVSLFCNTKVTFVPCLRIESPIGRKSNPVLPITPFFTKLWSCDCKVHSNLLVTNRLLA